MVSEPDKGYLYGKYQEAADWQQKLLRKASHKALDIGDDMGVYSVRNGIGWKELAVLAATGIAGLALWWNSQKPVETVDTDTTRATTIETFNPRTEGQE